VKVNVALLVVILVVCTTTPALATEEPEIDLELVKAKKRVDISFPDPEPLTPIEVKPPPAESWLVMMAVAGWVLAGVSFAIMLLKDCATHFEGEGRKLCQA